MNRKTEMDIDQETFPDTASLRSLSTEIQGMVSEKTKQADVKPRKVKRVEVVGEKDSEIDSSSHEVLVTVYVQRLSTKVNFDVYSKAIGGKCRIEFERY